MPVKKIAIATVLGGLTLFAWGAISQTLLPLYNGALHKFTNEDAVTQAIAANTPHSGTYFLPNYPDVPAGANAEQKKATDEKMEQAMASGPMVFAHVRVGAMGGMGTYLATELLTNIIAALFVTLLLSQTTNLSFRNRVMFAAGVALVMIFDGTASEWNWYSAGGDFFLAEAVDGIVGWSLAGVVIAKLLPASAQKTA